MVRLFLFTVILLCFFPPLFLVAEWGLDLFSPYPVHLIEGRKASMCIKARDGSVLRVVPTASGERAFRVSLDTVNRHVVNALIAGEDKRFRHHTGVDFTAVVRAALTNLVQGRVVSGASTLTMQVVRLVEPRPRTCISKGIEVFRARQLERVLSKDRILEAYLNLAPFGGVLRGIEAAALYWFGKHAVDLAPEEAATLVAMLPAPTARSPHRSPIWLVYHRNRVLDRMLKEEMISPETHARAVAAPLGAKKHPWPFLAPHLCDRIVIAREDRRPMVHTSLDLDLQQQVEVVVRGHDDAGVDGVAVVVLDRDTGAVRAMVGSRDYRRHPLNAACCRRAPGSTLKPFLYGLAMEVGILGPDSLVLDTRVEFGDFRPMNFSEDFSGPMRAADALAESRNIPAVRLLRSVGVDRFRDLLHRVGLATSGQIHLDAALGTMSISPLELAQAYVALCGETSDSGLGKGTRNQLLRMLGRHSPAPDVVPSASMAWKTGTSSGRRDAWSVGVTAEVVVVVWLGNLDGGGAPDLVGGRSAAKLLAGVVSVL